MEDAIFAAFSCERAATAVTNDPLLIRRLLETCDACGAETWTDDHMKLLLAACSFAPSAEERETAKRHLARWIDVNDGAE